MAVFEYKANIANGGTTPAGFEELLIFGSVSISDSNIAGSGVSFSTGNFTDATSSFYSGAAIGNYPIEVIERCGRIDAPLTVPITFTGFTPGQIGTFSTLMLYNASSETRGGKFLMQGVTKFNGGTDAVEQVFDFVADENGEVTGEWIADLDVGNRCGPCGFIVSWDDTNIAGPSGPTITDINTNNQVTPGVTAALTGTNLTNATGVNIGSVSQTGFTVVNDTTVTFTGTRGGNPYNQDLTATLLSPDGDATITVQQVPEAGTFAVTAASPNTTDDASLWANTVDTATGDPVTVVNGDQFWVNSTMPGLAIDPTGAITANETGTFTGQFWRASEGVWGSDQTVSFTLPEEDDPAPPAFGRRLKKALNLTLKNSLRTDI